MALAARPRLCVVLAVAWLVLAACGGSNAPPRHPIGKIGARLEARLDVIELVIADRSRAARVRQIYLRAWEIGHEFDVDRARALVEARSLMRQRTTVEAQALPRDPAALERVLAPPLEVSRRAYERYTTLMLEARALMTAAEFERLDAVR